MSILFMFLSMLPKKKYIAIPLLRLNSNSIGIFFLLNMHAYLIKSWTCLNNVVTYLFLIHICEKNEALNTVRKKTKWQASRHVNIKPTWNQNSSCLPYDMVALGLEISGPGTSKKKNWLFRIHVSMLLTTENKTTSQLTYKLTKTSELTS